MPMRPVVEEISQIGIESVEGTAVAANKRLLAIGFNLKEAAEFDQIQPMGSVVPTSVPMRQNWSTFEISGDSYPDYNGLLYLFSMLFGAPTTTVPGGATLARQHLWTPPITAISKQTATMQKGQPGGTAESATGATLTDLALSFSRTAAQDLKGSGYAGVMDYSSVVGVNESQTVTITGTPTGGTFTLTYAGQTTAGIAYNAIASAVQTALRALSTIGSTGCSVTGGPGPGTPYVVTFTGALANADIALLTASAAGLTGGTTPAVAVTETQKGGITDIAVVPILAGQVDVFMDTTGAGIGTTKLLTDFSAEWSIGKMRAPAWVLNSALGSYKESVAQRPDAMFSLELGNDSVSRALITDMRAGTTKFVEIRATGGLVEAGQNYSLKIQLAGQIHKAPSAGDQNGASTLPYELRSVYDPTWAKWMEVRLVNGLTGV